MDGLTNLIDYGFHIYLAWALLPGDFAVVQTVNTTLLVVLTTLAVMQPVVARYVAEAAVSGANTETEKALFQHYFGRSLILGLGLTAVAWLTRRQIASWLNVPPAIVAAAALMLLLATVRPVLLGMLQGRRQFIWFGLTRLVYAIGRFGVALLLIGWFSQGTLGAVAAIPLGALISLLAALLVLGRRLWMPVSAKVRNVAGRSGGWLPASAFIAYAAYMSLLSVDLIWVNRSFAADVTGSYATAVLLRRALLLLPGAIVVIMYPRVVARVVKGQLPDKLLAQTAVVIALPTMLLTGVYAWLGPVIVRWTFGPAYLQAAPLLGWMGVAMLGVGLTVIWLNFYLATRPLPFVLVLVGTAVGQYTALAAFHETLMQVTWIFLAGAWLPALAGLGFYVAWLRPSLLAADSKDRGLFAAPENETQEWNELLTESKERLEDFWRRRKNRPQFEQAIRLFGHPLLMQSNEEAALTAVSHSLPLFTQAPDRSSTLGRVQLVVQSQPRPPGPPPDDLMQHIQYSGDGDWLMMQLGLWGHAHVDLATRRATAVLTPELANRPELVGQCLLNTIWLNFVIAHGYGMLHASCLIKEQQALLLLAPHNTGKSTTALRLALSGWSLLSDSVVFVDEIGNLMGFPVGKIKLRADMLSEFPQLQSMVQPEVVRQETKFSVDLRQGEPDWVQETAVQPTSITLCLLARHNRLNTQIQPALFADVQQAIIQNSLYYDQTAVWQRNLDRLSPLLQKATAYHLTIGTDSQNLLNQIHTLCL